MENANDYLQKKYKSLAKENATFKDLPEIYIRVGLPKKVKDKYLPSRNHYLGILEDGISVFTARYSPNSKFVFVDLDSESNRSALYETYNSFKEDIQNGLNDIMYLLEGSPLLDGSGGYQVGADDERLLNTKELKVIGKLNPKKIIIYDKGTPSRDKSIIYYDTETLSGNELKKYPKYKNGGSMETEYKVIFESKSGSGNVRDVRVSAKNFNDAKKKGWVKSGLNKKFYAFLTAHEIKELGGLMATMQIASTGLTLHHTVKSFNYSIGGL